MAAGLDTGRKNSLKTALYLILDCGLRPHEIVHLQVTDLDFEQRLIRVLISKTKAGERLVPMTSRVEEKLRAVLPADGWLFPSSRNPSGHILRKALSEAWRRVCLEVGVPAGVKLYCARHTYATDVMRATRDPFLTMRLMGHTKISVTEKYQHPELDEVAAMMDARNELRQRHNLRHSAPEDPLI